MTVQEKNNSVQWNHPGVSDPLISVINIPKQCFNGRPTRTEQRKKPEFPDFCRFTFRKPLEMFGWSLNDFFSLEKSFFLLIIFIDAEILFLPRMCFHLNNQKHSMEQKNSQKNLERRKVLENVSIVSACVWVCVCVGVVCECVWLVCVVQMWCMFWCELSYVFVYNEYICWVFILLCVL